MKNHLLFNFGFNLQYAKMLTADIPEDQMADQPGNIPNHAAWVIGHLATTLDYLGASFGLEPACPEEWGALVGNGSTPVSDRSQYPDKQTLIAALENGHSRISEAIASADDDLFTSDSPEGIRSYFPTVGDFTMFVCTSHAATHLGQLSAWRRAKELPSVMG